MKKAMISIKSTQTAGEETDTTEIITQGRYSTDNGSCVLSYEETEATGYDGSVTCVKVESGRWLKMLRTGSASAELFIELGRKNYCHYETPYGDMTMGVLAKKVDADVSEDGGHISAEYEIDVNSMLLGNFKLEIEVRPE